MWLDLAGAINGTEPGDRADAFPGRKLHAYLVPKVSILPSTLTEDWSNEHYLVYMVAVQQISNTATCEISAVLPPPLELRVELGIVVVTHDL